MGYDVEWEQGYHTGEHISCSEFHEVMTDYYWDENFLTTGEIIATNWPKTMEIVGLAKQDLIELDKMVMAVAGPIENWVFHVLHLMGYEIRKLRENTHRHVVQIEKKLRHVFHHNGNKHGGREHHHGDHHHHHEEPKQDKLFDDWLENDWGNYLLVE